jgi:2-dehydropantoate 2-reductase
MASILIIGAGAIGAFFGSALARQGAAVSVVCRSDYDAVRRSGYEIRSNLLGDHTFVPTNVFESPDQAGRDFDFVVLTTKVTADTDRVALLKPTVSARATIMLIQNGLDIESEIASAFPDNELISGIAFIAVSRTAPGKVHHQSEGSLTIGRYPSGSTSAVEQMSMWFNASKVPCRVAPDIVTARWQKALWNATFNPISIMGGVLDTAAILRTAESQSFVRETMREIAAIAAAAGHPLKEELIDRLIQGTLQCRRTRRVWRSTTSADAQWNWKRSWET